MDPESGWMYVNANDLAWTGGLAVNEPPVNGGTLYRQQCAACHRDDFAGTPPQIPTLVGVARGEVTRRRSAHVIRTGAGRMPGFPNLSSNAVNAIVEYMTTGRDVRPTSVPAPGSAVVPEVPLHRVPKVSRSGRLSRRRARRGARCRRST